MGDTALSATKTHQKHGGKSAIYQQFIRGLRPGLCICVTRETGVIHLFTCMYPYRPPTPQRIPSLYRVRSESDTKRGQYWYATHVYGTVDYSTLDVTFYTLKDAALVFVAVLTFSGAGGGSMKGDRVVEAEWTGVPNAGLNDQSSVTVHIRVYSVNIQ